MKPSKVNFNFSDDFLDDTSSDEEDGCRKTTPLINDSLKKIRKKKHCKLEVDEVSSSEDEFEAEMDKDLDDEMKKIEYHLPAKSSSAKGSGTTETEFYDKVYFDSDSDEETSSDVKKNMNHPVLTNDDLLYDPEMDDEDQKWVDNQRRKYQPARGLSYNKHSTKLPNSDAILNCPCCMVLLCLDCQRHAVFNSQYRAMFVTNCRVIHSEILKYPLKNSTNKSKKRKHNGESASEASSLSKDSEGDDETYHPVHCTECDTEVAVFDKDEVFHFFNVLVSHA